MLHKDLLGREIRKGDYLAFRAQSAGIRVGLVVAENADGWEGAYTYVHKRVLVVQVDHKDTSKVNESVQKAMVFGSLIVTGLPHAVKDRLHKRAQELGYE